MSKDLLSKYYQDNKEKLLKNIKAFLKKKKKKSNNMGKNNIKIYLKMKNRN